MTRVSFEQYLHDRTGAQRQTRELKRVRKKLGDIIFVFCADRVGCRFSMDELLAYVRMHRPCAPDSASRILRLLKETGWIDYTVISRSESEYRILSIDESHGNTEIENAT